MDFLDGKVDFAVRGDCVFSLLAFNGTRHAEVLPRYLRCGFQVSSPEETTESVLDGNWLDSLSLLRPEGTPFPLLGASKAIAMCTSQLINCAERWTGSSTCRFIQ